MARQRSVPLSVKDNNPDARGADASSLALEAIKMLHCGYRDVFSLCSFKPGHLPHRETMLSLLADAF